MSPQGWPSGSTGSSSGFTSPSGPNGPPVGIAGGSPAKYPGAHAPGHELPLTPRGIHDVTGITTMLLLLCLAAVGGRLAARRITKTKMGYDDYAVVVALVSFVPSQIIIKCV